ncbi:hypothetical protein H696_00036 [Fonticula alba]|uniref:VWFA domain-containing protein n=1 Tax=Fonticula alba TaxID=691883 RepID=A0A058ZDH2_FONAL|nr:hypothetical protein H696_00036 [Fonticula alba]KCV72444.1 hypothetical protein H696_00036 [Fonticula alba]|eukprot:XP_009492145.1 hypothetical protein H696_00036 [Fonticula alba]
MGSSSSTQRSSVPRIIGDNFSSIEEVQQALRRANLESSNLIFAVDYTSSNQHTGKNSFGGRCLHWLDPHREQLNPYQQAIGIIGATLESFDEDKLIPSFGFGDVNTHDRAVFPLHTDPRGCYTFKEVLERYEQVTPHVQMSGPTCFAPAIMTAVNIVRQSQNQYHILVIVADGQVSNPRKTRDALIEASKYPLSIIVVGVGDGPWDQMEYFDDMPGRIFDNFQFVNFHKVLSQNPYHPEPAFALAALMEIPEQFHAIRKLEYL